MKTAIQKDALPLGHVYQQQPLQIFCWTTIAIKQCCEPNCDELALAMSNHQRENEITAV